MTDHISNKETIKIISDNTLLCCTDEINHSNTNESLLDKTISQKLELKSEITEAINNGYEVTIGNTNDEAYRNPEMINEMFNTLDKKGKAFSDLRHEITKLDLGVISLTNVGQSMIRKSHARKEDRIEEIRANILFDDTKMPWHLQRGSALALQTIIDSHDLIAFDNPTSKNGLYPTMSGCLPEYDKTFTFGENDGSLSGLNLEDAIIQSRQRFYSESTDDATKKTNESLHNLDTFFNAPVTQDFKDIITYCYDALGIRSRKQEVCNAVSNHFDNVLKNNPDKNNAVLLSIGCGTAQAILEVAYDIRKKGIKPQVILLDQDPIALAAAKSLAEQMDLKDAIEIHCERLFDLKGKPLDMTQILDGRKVDVAEDTGLREYLPDKIYRNLTNAVWNHLSDDGMMTTGNMNINRPQPEFLNGLMGWQPNVIMRNVQRGFELHEQSNIPKGNTKARITRDGVYTLFFSYK